MLVSARLGPFAKGALGAIVGGLLLASLFHLYQDHRVLHEIVSLINAQVAAAKPAAPTATVP